MRSVALAALCLLPAACLPYPTVINGEGDDTGCGLVDYYLDADGDGHGDADNAVQACDDAPVPGRVLIGDDCDDQDGAAWDPWTGWQDVDGDHFGLDGTESAQCAANAAVAIIGGDCDDGDASSYPDAPIVCGDGVDNNCDALGDCDAPVGSEGAADLDAQLVGDETDELGLSAAAVGDMDGDGVGDLLVGSTREHALVGTSGRAWLVSGALSGSVDLKESAILLGDGAVDDRAGAAVAGGADLTGDGLPDLVVGASTGGASNSGVVWLLAGPVTGERTLASDQAIALNGESTADQAGAAIALLPDAGDDGVADLAVGAPTALVGSARSGTVYLLPQGATVSDDLVDLGARLSTGASDADLGRTLASVGDLDGDGVDEVAVGAPGLVTLSEDDDDDALGAIFLVSGAQSGALDIGDVALATLYGLPTGALGLAFCDAGDQDGDGVHDLLVGDPGASELAYGGGEVWLLSGASLVGAQVVGGIEALASVQGDVSDEAVGASVAAVGDSNGDGLRELAVGAPGFNTDAGAHHGGGVALFYSPATPDLLFSSADLLISGPTTDARLGAAVFDVGDLDGLGMSELLIGAPGPEKGDPGRGTLYLLSLDAF